MKILVVGGAGGQLGKTFLSLPAHGFTFTPSPRIDTNDEAALSALIKDFDVVINCAAWTDVRGAEDPANRAAVRDVNVILPGLLSIHCAIAGKCFVHFSTDYVFNGEKRTPYVETDATDPASVYGKSKLAGEEAALADPSSLVIRTAGLYSPYGKNFVKTILGKLAEGCPFIVNDRLTTNVTDAESLALFTLAMLTEGVSGVRHFVGSPGTTWYDVALIVGERADGWRNMSHLIRPGFVIDGVNRPRNSALRSLHELSFTRAWPEKLQETVRTILMQPGL